MPSDSCKHVPLAAWILLVTICPFVLNPVIAQNGKPAEAGKSPSILSERPRVMRSVLDGQTHVLAVELNPSFRVAYHTRTGRLYKAWPGKIKMRGPVYGGYSGRPETTGPGYVKQSVSSTPWRVVRSGETTIPNDVQFRGYEFQNGRIHLTYELRIGNGRRVKVQETPRHVRKDGRDGLVRRFRTWNVPEDVRLVLETQIGRVAEKKDVRSNGELQLSSSRAGNGGTNGDGRMLHGRLKLVRNEVTELHTLYRSVPEGQPGKPKATEEPEQDGLTLMENSDCFTCHAEGKKITGPAFRQIAERYDPSHQVVTRLVESIRKGGSGNWGSVPMTPHPNLSEHDLETMVNYILSLEEEEEDEEEDLFLGVPTDTLEFASDRPHAGEDQQTVPGLLAKLYRYEIKNPTVETVNEKIRQVRRRRPVKNGVARRVHFTDRAHIGPYDMFFHIEFKGALRIDQAGTYTFRTVSNDGSQLYVDEKHLIDNGGFHPAVARTASVELSKGSHDLRLMYYQAGGTASVSLQWKKPGDEEFSVIPKTVLSHRRSQVPEVLGMLPEKLRRRIPGDTNPVPGVHPSFDLEPARPATFRPRVGGMDFLPDGRLVVSTWDPKGSVYLVSGHATGEPDRMSVKEIARGLNDPMGVKVVDGEIFVIQRTELTKLIDRDGDDVTDVYRTVADDWDLSTNFHEYAFGLVYKDGDFFVTLGQSIQVGGPSVEGQERDRGRVVRIDRDTGEVSFPAHGLRMPNGIGVGPDDEIFLSDNQGDWLPASKILHLRKGSFYGAHSVDPTGTAGLEGTPPVVWLPQDQIGNSPSQPLRFEGKPYEGQMIHGDVHHGGIKRVFVEAVHGTYQGAVFRFSQGLEAGVNRLAWGPDGALYVGGVGRARKLEPARKEEVRPAAIDV